MKQLHPAFGIGLALAAAMLWGTTGTAQSLAPPDLSPVWIGAARLAIASLFLLVVAAAMRRSAPQRGTSVMGRVMLAGACMAAYNLAFFAGVKWTGVAVGTTVAIGSGPLFAGLLQTVLLRQVPPPRWWLGTALAIGGGLLMTLQGSSSAEVNWAGIALCLTAGLAYASYALLAKSLATDLTPAGSTARIFTAAALFALPIAWFLAGSPMAGDPATGRASGIEARSWVVVAYLGIIATGVSYLLFSQALRTISGATAVTLALAEPVTAFLLAIVVVGERPGAATAVGLVLVLTGLGVVISAERQGVAGRGSA